MRLSYTRWLHTQWPAGTIEPRPEVGSDGLTSVPGVRVAGELAGRILLRDAADSGARAVQAIVAERGFAASADPAVPDIAVVGAGVAGISAAIEARRAGLSVAVYEATAPFSALSDLRRSRPVILPPVAPAPAAAPAAQTAGGLAVIAGPREQVLADLNRQRLEAGVEPETSLVERIEARKGAVALHHAGGRVTTAQRVIVAIGRSGSFPRLGCPGDDLDKVHTRILDPTEYAGKRALVAGDGDEAIETAIALTTCGTKVTLACSGADFKNPQAENVANLRQIAEQPEAQVHVEHPSSERVTTATMRNMKSAEGPGSLRIRMAARVERIGAAAVTLAGGDGAEEVVPNDVVFSMIGRADPAGFMKRSGLRLHGARDAAAWIGLLLSLFVCTLVFHWAFNRQELPIHRFIASYRAFPYDVPGLIDSLGGTLADLAGRETHLVYTVKASLGDPVFYLALAWCLAVTAFGVRRIARRRTPYVLWQTLSLIAAQWVFLFLVPLIVLPWAGRNGYFERGQSLRWIADQLFERTDGYLGHERAYWRSYGLILPFPLNVYNAFTDRPMWTWLAISALQAFVGIPLVVRHWGKGGFCGWICPAGALAETMGDAHREKMPHGPQWNRLNMVGQAVLAVVLGLLGLRFLAWSLGPRSWAQTVFTEAFTGLPFLNYTWLALIVLGGVVGIGSTFWFSGRVWCRFACPLGALAHVHARSSLFRILPDKAACISCGVCTSVCHAGVDVMNFANKDQPVRDPQCVRCSACVEQCPTAALAFGHVRKSGEVVFDRLRAIPAHLVSAKP
jgi:thioredoxin reductase/ferredoxin